jgi:lipoate-protein ligase A
MLGKTIYKVPKGKLLKIRLDYEEKTHTIQGIEITGDFFAYPEDSIEHLEKALLHTPLKEDMLRWRIADFVGSRQVEFIGLTVEDLTRGILRCIA